MSRIVWVLFILGLLFLAGCKGSSEVKGGPPAARKITIATAHGPLCTVSPVTVQTVIGPFICEGAITVELVAGKRPGVIYRGTEAPVLSAGPCTIEATVLVDAGSALCRTMGVGIDRVVVVPGGYFVYFTGKDIIFHQTGKREDLNPLLAIPFEEKDLPTTLATPPATQPH